MPGGAGWRFRGWRVLAGLFLLYAASNGILMHSLPLFYPQLMDEFAWDATQVTLPATVFFVVGAVTSPPAGALLDRFPARRVMGLGVAGIILGLALLSRMRELWHMVAVFALFGLSLSLCGLVSNMLVLSRWFDRLRGRATGFLLMASSLGGFVFPAIAGFGMASWGWRGMLLVFALLGTVLMVLPLALLVRARPQDHGLHPDGLAQQQRLPAAAAGPSWREAVTGRAFYLLALATAATWFCIVALVQHQSIYLGRDHGLPGAQLGIVFSVFFGASALGKFLFGLLGDHFAKDRVMAASLLLLVAGLALLYHVDTDRPLSLYGYAVVAGIGFSGAFTSIQVLLAQFFAGPSFGRILATLVLVDTLAGALGVRVVARLRAGFDSYHVAFAVMIGLCLLAVLCLQVVRLPQGAGR